MWIMSSSGDGSDSTNEKNWNSFKKISLARTSFDKMALIQINQLMVFESIYKLHFPPQFYA